MGSGDHERLLVVEKLSAAPSNSWVTGNVDFRFGRFLSSRCLPRKCPLLPQEPSFRSSGQPVRFRPKAWVCIASVLGLTQIIHANHHRRESAAALFGTGLKPAALRWRHPR